MVAGKSIRMLFRSVQPAGVAIDSAEQVGRVADVLGGEFPDDVVGGSTAGGEFPNSPVVGVSVLKSASEIRCTGRDPDDMLGVDQIL
jgi:hypothetical protein